MRALNRGAPKVAKNPVRKGITLLAFCETSFPLTSVPTFAQRSGRIDHARQRAYRRLLVRSEKVAACELEWQKLGRASDVAHRW